MTKSQDDDQLEHKKWLVNRFEVGMERMLSELMIVRETFNSRMNSVENRLKEWRSAIIAAVVFFATVTLGISSVFYNQTGFSYHLIVGVLFSDIIVGVTAFAVLIFLRNRVYSTVQEVDMAFLSAIDRLNYLHGYFISVTADIKHIEIGRLNFFVNYREFAGFAVRLEQVNAYNTVYSSILFRSIRSHLENSTKAGNALMNMGQALYKNFEEEFDRYEIDFLNLNYVHEYFLEHFNIIYPTPKLKPFRAR